MKKNIIFLTAAIALFIAILDLPSGYYQLLRWFICGVGAYGAYINYQNKKIKWAWTLGIIALIFNPFFKFYFWRETWKVVDLIAGIIFVVYYKKNKKANGQKTINNS